MDNRVKAFTKAYTKTNIPPIRSGDTVRVYEKIKDKNGERLQMFEGVVIARKHGVNNPNSTFTVRKISVHRVGVEKIFPIHSPNIQKIEVVKHDKVRRAKLYYIRDLKKKKKKKPSKLLGLIYEETVPEENYEESTEESSTDNQEANADNDEDKKDTSTATEQAPDAPPETQVAQAEDSKEGDK